MAVDPEVVEEVTLEDALAGSAREKALDLLRGYAEAVRDPDSAFNIKGIYRSQLRDLVDPVRIEKVQPDDDPLLAVADRFAQDSDEEGDDVLAAIRAALSVTGEEGPVFRTAAEALKDPEPLPLLSRNGGGAILSAGEIAVISGEGGAGKSTLAAQLALTAARTDPSTFASVAGLTIRGGPVVVLSYEDRAKRVADRLIAVERHLRDMADRDGSQPPPTIPDPLDRVHVADMAGWPLFGVAPGGRWGDPPGPLAGWSSTWKYIRDLEPLPGLVVIDPAGEAFAANSNELSGVRAFYGALRKRAEAIGCGVLLVAHSTKEDRKKNEATPGSVAGSAAWTDAARGVLTLDRESRDPENPQPNDSFKLRLIKANYAARFALDLKAWTRSNGALIGFHEREEGQTGSSTTPEKENPNSWEVDR